MPVGSLLVRLVVHQAQSLKDKRRVVRSLLDRVQNRYNISIVEMEGRDSRQESMLEAAMVRSTSRQVESDLSQVVNFLRTSPEAVVVDYSIEHLA
ncbi:MAG: DUF503 domain-containing protein [Planctomycetes bacterium]|nr:DUF503 domain-containing protein [Planctomycetota bacterium]